MLCAVQMCSILSNPQGIVTSYIDSQASISGRLGMTAHEPTLLGIGFECKCCTSQRHLDTCGVFLCLRTCELFPHSWKRSRNDSDISNRSHKVRVTTPARNNVHMQMLRYARATSLPFINADVHALRVEFGFEYG